MANRTIKTSQFQSIIVNGYAAPDITRQALADWSADLTYGSCFSYGFTIEGDLVLIDDEEFIRNAYITGVAPLMVISPYNELGEYRYELLKAVFTIPIVRDRLINNIVLTVLEKHYYGAVLNFGYIAPEDANQFVITVSKTASRLNRSGTLCIVTLTPGSFDAGIDYRSLGMAANFIELKTFHAERFDGPPSVITPADTMRGILRSNVARINSGKILLGLPNTGLENENSIEAKLNLIREFGLAGISIWTIMSPFPAGRAAINQMYTVFKIS